MIEIPPDRLAPEVLEGIIESFIAREGTDYGVVECSLSTKIEQVKKQLQKGDVVITFDPETESCNILSRRDVLAAQSLATPPTDDIS